MREKHPVARASKAPREYVRRTAENVLSEQIISAAFSGHFLAMGM